MKKELFVLMFLVLIVNVSAISVKEDAINSVIIPDYDIPAEIELTISDAVKGDYNIYTLTDVIIKPSTSFSLDDGLNRVTIFVHDTINLEERGYYQFSYNVNHLGGENHGDSMTVRILDIGDVLEIGSDSNDPESGVVNFYVKNLVEADIPEIKASFSSAIFNFDETFSLEGNGVKLFEVPVEKLGEVEAGGYIVKMKLETLSGEKEISGKIYLSEKDGIETQEDDSGFIIKKKIINKINVGNTQQDVQVRIKKDFFSRFFTSFNTEPNSIQKDGSSVIYVWNKRLGPAEILNVKVSTNYLTPILILIFVIILIYGIRMFTKKKIVLEKSVSRVRTKDDKFALRIKIKMKVLKAVENVSVIDKVPAVVKVFEKSATLKPDNIDLKNRRLQWNFGDLGEGEERVFSYVVYSKIGVVGKFSLPPASAIFEKEGQIHETESNVAHFYHEEK